MLDFKKLIIQPTGTITGGFFQYNLDSNAGIITYEGEVFFFSKTIPFSGVTVVEPKLLKSANLKAGDKFQFGDISVTVVSVSSLKAHCNISVSLSGNMAYGVAIFDLKEESIALESLDAAGRAMGLDIVLKARV